MALTTVVDKLKDNNLNLSKSTKSAPNKKKLKGNQSQSDNNNSKCKSKGKTNAAKGQLETRGSKIRRSTDQKNGQENLPLVPPSLLH